MPVSISGDGTVSGITTFTSAATFSGAVALPAGTTLAGTTLRNGRLLQALISQPSGQVNTSSTNPVSLNWSQSITIGANSRIMVTASVGAFGGGTAGSWGASSRAFLYVNGSMVITNDHTGTVSNEAQVFTVPLLYLSGTLSAGTYTVAVFGASVTGGQIEFGRGGNNGSQMVVMEVAG